MKALLQIFIVTYNRSEKLSQTLKNLIKSDFGNFDITVLNNCSTDNTSQIVNQYSNSYSNISLVTHSVNIGASANVLRAIEFSTAKYTWILCDDDYYDFSNVDDVISKLEDGNVDLVHVGAHTCEWLFGGISDTPKNLLIKGYHYFMFSSFLPCNIFRTKGIQNEYLIMGYNNIGNAYPHMPFLQSLFYNNSIIYLSKRKIVTASINTQSYDINSWMIWWINTSMLMKSKRDVRLHFFDHFRTYVDSNLIVLLKSVSASSIKNARTIRCFIRNYFTMAERFRFFLNISIIFSKLRYHLLKL